MISDLIAQLAKRGVRVAMTGRYSQRRREMSFTAVVNMEDVNNGAYLAPSWPRFEFKVWANDMDDLENEIKKRLPLVEPIIAAAEKHLAHQQAVRVAHDLGNQLRDIVGGVASPNQARDESELGPLPMTEADEPTRNAA